MRVPVTLRGNHVRYCVQHCLPPNTTATNDGANECTAPNPSEVKNGRILRFITEEKGKVSVSLISQ